MVWVGVGVVVVMWCGVCNPGYRNRYHYDPTSVHGLKEWYKEGLEGLVLLVVCCVVYVAVAVAVAVVVAVHDGGCRAGISSKCYFCIWPSMVYDLSEEYIYVC